MSSGQCEGPAATDADADTEADTEAEGSVEATSDADSDGASLALAEADITGVTGSKRGAAVAQAVTKRSATQRAG